MFACLICMIILRGCTRGDPIHSCGILRFDFSNDYYIILIKFLLSNTCFNIHLTKNTNIFLWLFLSLVSLETNWLCLKYAVQFFAKLETS